MKMKPANHAPSLLLVVGISFAARANVVTFDNLTPTDCVSIVSSGGLDFANNGTACMGVFVGNPNGNGTLALALGANGYTAIRKTGGGAFNLNSFDMALSWYETASARNITITAHFQGGGTSTQTLTLIQALQTYSLALLNVVEVDVSALSFTGGPPAGYWVMDNVNFSLATCSLPDGVINESKGWASGTSTDLLYTVGLFNIGLAGQGDFSGRVIKEEDAGGSRDYCYFPGASVGPISLGHSTWNVFSGNLISPPLDQFGLGEDQVDAYRRGRKANGLPVACQVVLHQQMSISCPDGTFRDFGPVNRLIYTVGEVSISVQRDGVNGTGAYESKRYITQ